MRVHIAENERAVALCAEQSKRLGKVVDKTMYVVDAEGMRLGRMASECAKILLGKNKAEFTPGADVGDAVVIINAEKVIVTGKKAEDKLYRRHSGRPGGMKLESYNELQVSVARAEARTESPLPVSVRHLLT